MLILEAVGIKKRFGGVTALSNGNLKCKTGRVTGLLGANGSGKSTISKIICGVYSADAGEISYEGKPVRFKNPSEARNNGIFMVFQNLSLVPNLTIWQNMVLGREEKKGLFLNNSMAREVSKNILSQLLPGLNIERKIFELNPGEMQIVEIAKAISANPKLLILDEPTAALEQEQVKNLFKYMRQLAKKGIPMIFTSHRLWEIMEICDDVTIFRNGASVLDLDFDKDKKDPEEIVSAITGETKKSIAPNKESQIHNEVILKVEKLNYQPFLKDVSFELKKGEILGVGGLAGQGQRELMLALAGNYPQATCDASINGKKIKLTQPANPIRNGFLFVPGDKQLEGLFMNHSVFTNMIFPKLGLGKQPLFTPTKKYRDECAEAINILSIKAHNLDVPVNTLSGGNQQKVVVGKWLSFKNAHIWLLSDPAKGIDVGSKIDLYQYIMSMAREKNMSVILYASDNEELIDYCDRLLIMYEGQIVECLDKENIDNETIIAASMRHKRVS